MVLGFELFYCENEDFCFSFAFSFFLYDLFTNKARKLEVADSKVFLSLSLSLSIGFYFLLLFTVFLSLSLSLSLLMPHFSCCYVA